MEILVPKIIATLLLPPGGPIILVLLGILMVGRRRRSGLFLVIAGVGLLVLLSMPPVGKGLIRSLERYPPLSSDIKKSDAGAIVVLGGGLYANAPEYGGADIVGTSVLARLYYAVWFHRRTGLPILVAGGSVFGRETPESIIIARSLREDFGVNPKWVEDQSRNTRENALYSKRILDRAGIDHVYVITHAWHMWRAVAAFERTGLRVTPAPTRFLTRSETDSTILRYLPSAGGLAMSATALHEYLGWLWYRLREYGFGLRSGKNAEFAEARSRGGK